MESKSEGEAHPLWPKSQKAWMAIESQVRLSCSQVLTEHRPLCALPVPGSGHVGGKDRWARHPGAGGQGGEVCSVGMLGGPSSACFPWILLDSSRHRQTTSSV